ASPKKRASLHCVRGEAALAELDPGGIEVLGISVPELQAALTRENRTLKRALTDPRILSGIGNSYSDEILHAAQLSPLKRTRQLTDEEMIRLHEHIHLQLELWTQRTRDEVGTGFPDKVTAFRKEMAVHGKYEKPCPVCGNPVQRIRYASNECNYCATCQTDGRLLSDRSLARLLKGDWPKTLEDLYALKRGPG
ncbi:MAG: formamidopyrimidine-DNA glycosylase, partial [Myxococcota bacterium]